MKGGHGVWAVVGSLKDEGLQTAQFIPAASEKQRAAKSELFVLQHQLERRRLEPTLSETTL
ncbi:hypothetical protein NQZ68_027633 [Dissostichus eleginoides]|nr:hypothetical protein NQZ68_027633 [Dissostichus eleginoides]